VNGRGKRMVRTHSDSNDQKRKYLRESVVNPAWTSARLSDDHGGETKDARGSWARNAVMMIFRCSLMDAPENYYSFQKSDVTSIKQEYKSLMPDTYAKLSRGGTERRGGPTWRACAGRGDETMNRALLILLAVARSARSSGDHSERLLQAQSDPNTWLMSARITRDGATAS